MYNSIWATFADEIERRKCDWCFKSEHDLYLYIDDTVCQHCLLSTQVEEPEYGLTLEERNK